MTARNLLRKSVPYWLRLELLRLRRLPTWILEIPTIARVTVPPAERDRFRHVLAEHASPLQRESPGVDPRLQAGKKHNVSLAASLLDGTLVSPNQVFSYYHRVGRPSRLRGFRRGLELHAGNPSAGIGGGCCQIANMLYLVALRAGMKITERHRHSLDLFPDHDRRVPFGCGATVFYNYADLRFENPLTQPVLMNLWTDNDFLHGRLLAPEAPPWTVEVLEVDHRFFQAEGEWYRENRILRRFRRADGTLMLERLEAHNRARVLYDPEASRCCGQ